MRSLTQYSIRGRQDGARSRHQQLADSQIQLDESSVQGKRRWKPCRFGTRLQRFRNRARVEHRVSARTVGQQFQIVVIMHAHQRPFQSSSQLWSCATHASCISNQCSKQNFGALCYVHTRAAPQSLQAQHLLYTRCTQLWASVF
jgi:hypothetical protein